MTGCEEQVLKIVRELKTADREAVNRKMRVSPAYVGQLCDVLVKDGYLVKVGKANYALTDEGRRVLEPFKGRSRGTPLRGMGGIAVSIYP